MRLAPCLVFCASLAALSACAGPYQPAPSDAAIVPPAQWRLNVADGSEIDAVWWHSFGDSSLNALVSQALANNVDLKIASERIEEAKAQLRLTDSQRMPAAGLAGDGATSRGISPFGKGVDQDRGQLLASASYEIDLFGRLHQSSAAAQADLLASREARETLRISLITTVIESYIGLLSLDSRLQIIRQTVDERREERDLLHRRFGAGYTSRLEAEQAEAALEAATRLLPSTQLAISQRENALSILIGLPPGKIARNGAARLSDLPIPQALPSQLLRQRPDIAQAESRIIASDHRLMAARASFMPRLTLNGGGGVAASTLFSDPISLFSIGGSILAPLFEGGALKANRDIAVSRRDQAAYAYRSVVLQAFAEVDDAIASGHYLHEEGQAASRQVAASQAAYVAAKRRYDAGYSSYLEQLDAERTLLAARIDDDDLRFRRLIAIVDLYRALGGGWSAGTPAGEQVGA